MEAYPYPYFREEIDFSFINRLSKIYIIKILFITGAILDIVNNTFRKREQLILIVFLLIL